MKGNTPRLWGGLMPIEVYRKFWDAIKNKKIPFEAEFTNRRKNGELYYAHARVSPVVSNEKLMGFIGTEEDVTELKELNKMKDDFLSMAAHELRTPMTAIKGFVSMIMDGDYGETPEKINKPLKDIQTSTERLIRLVNDLLNISRLEQGRMKFDLSEFDAGTVVKKIVESLTPVANEKKVELKFNSGAKLNVFADRDKVEQLVINLIGNSLKFTDKGYIETIVRKNGKEIWVSVKDTGIGIEKKDQERIFGKFEQIADIQKGRPQGTGLGLYVSQMLARKMGGDLWLENSEVGKGSKFIFSLLSIKSKKIDAIKKQMAKEEREHPDQKDMAVGK
jgi:signal transduction histidine kinase